MNREPGPVMETYQALPFLLNYYRVCARRVLTGWDGKAYTSRLFVHCYEDLIDGVEDHIQADHIQADHRREVYARSSGR